LRICLRAKKNIDPVILIPSITNHKPITFYCISTLWSNKKPVVMRVHKKAIPLQACTDPEGSRRLRLPDFMKIGTRRW